MLVYNYDLIKSHAFLRKYISLKYFIFHYKINYLIYLNYQ